MGVRVLWLMMQTSAPEASSALMPSTAYGKGLAFLMPGPYT